jgi:hypothetical protein
MYILLGWMAEHFLILLLKFQLNVIASWSYCSFQYCQQKYLSFSLLANQANRGI